MYMCVGCEEDDLIERAFLAHKLASKKQIFVGKISMKPTNAARNIVQFRAKQLRSLSMHPAQSVRLMYNSGQYVLGPEMVCNGAISSCMPRHKSCLNCCTYASFLVYDGVIPGNHGLNLLLVDISSCPAVCVTSMVMQADVLVWMRMYCQHTAATQKR
jgi:hypothetical protein